MPARSLPTLEEVCARALRLPCSPALLPRLIAVLAASDSSAEEIAAIVRIDPGLAASTLRLANSAYFGGDAAAETIGDAVLRLGQGELYRLAALALVSRWEAGAEYGEPGDFCRHALCTALAAEVLAEATGQVNPDTGYTSGLVADLGKLAIVHACPAAYHPVRAQCAARNGTWSEAEAQVLGFTHAQVGARLLRGWRFPAILIDATEFWERPERAPDEAQPLALHLQAAKYVATSCGPGVGEGGFHFEVRPALLLASGFTPELLQHAMMVAHERAAQRLGDRLTHGAIAL